MNTQSALDTPVGDAELAYARHYGVGRPVLTADQRTVGIVAAIYQSSNQPNCLMCTIAYENGGAEERQYFRPLALGITNFARRSARGKRG